MEHSDDLDDFTYDDSAEPCETVNNQKLEQVVRPFVHSAICVAGLLGNLLVIVAYTFYKRAKSMTDVYLLNVAFSDVLFAVALPLIIYNDRYDWSMGRWACKLLRGVYSVNLYSGTLLLACISADRYVAIVLAQRSFRIRSRALVYGRVVCSVVWAVALAFSLPTLVYYDTYGDGREYIGYGLNLSEAVADEDVWVGRRVCYFRFQGTETAHLMKVLVPSLQVSVGFLLPLLVIGFCYTAIVVTLLRARNFQRHKAMRVVVAVVTVFVACHLPYNVALLYRTAVLFDLRGCGREDAAATALTVTETLAYLHSCLNPVLYAFIGVKFRSHFRKILEDLRCVGKRSVSSGRSSRLTSDSCVSRKPRAASVNENRSFIDR